MRLNEEERAGLTRFVRNLNRGEVANDPQSAAALRALRSLLARMENRLTAVARTEARP